MQNQKTYFLPLFILGFCCCQNSNSWKIELENTATSSSCRTVELTGDGVLDIVLGAGAKEHESSENGVIAINGQTGKIIWKVPCRDQVVGSAIFKDITDDGIKEVFIGGRKNQLWCINGATGEIIWEYQKSIASFEPQDRMVLNFFNPQFVPDQDADQYPDILITWGGYVYADVNDFERPAGKLFVLSGKTGEILTELAMPDNMETYFSPIVYDFQNDGNPIVVFGSGGETINGGLYSVRLSDLMERKNENIIKIADGESMGFISPPVIIDISNDGIKDLIINSFDGRMMAFDGDSFELLWKIRVGYKVATFSSLAPIDVTGDGTMDFFGCYGEGVWNDYKGTVQVLVDGKTGKELKRYHLGHFQYSSPVIADVTGDGQEDILLHINTTTSTKEKDEKGSSIPTYSNRLVVFDYQNNKFFNLGKEMKGSNLLSTPLIGDLDSNGKTDVLFSHQTGANDIFSNEKLIIERMEIPVDFKDAPWSAYMGKNYDGIY